MVISKLCLSHVFARIVFAELLSRVRMYVNWGVAPACSYGCIATAVIRMVHRVCVAQSCVFGRVMTIQLSWWSVVPPSAATSRRGLLWPLWRRIAAFRRGIAMFRVSSSCFPDKRAAMHVS